MPEGQALGKDHPDVAVSLNNLADLYPAQDKYSAAEPLYKKSLWGGTEGKRVAVSDAKVKMAKRMSEDQSLSPRQICESLKISRATYYRYLTL